MPSTLTYPGVYVEEISSGVRTITGVATSITAFLGRAVRGPVATDSKGPVTINNFGDYERTFGGLNVDYPMSYAVQDFFRNGGSKAVIVRLFATAAGTPKAVLNVNGLMLEAAYEGSWGNTLRARIETSASASEVATQYNVTAADLFNIIVYDGATNTTETYLNVTTIESARRLDRILAESSLLVRAQTGVVWPLAATPTAHPTPATTQVWTDNTQSTGVITNAVDSDSLADTDYLGSQAAKSGIFSLDKVDLFNLLCIPPDTRAGDTTAAVYTAGMNYCASRRAMLIVDSPSSWTTAASITTSSLGTLGLTGTNSRNAAVFFPRVFQSDTLRGSQTDTFVPCGIIAGVMARTDASRGVWKAPAGIDATLSGVLSPSITMTDDENGGINPLGINCLRSFPIYGNVVWGARTARGADQLADEWKYIPVRRTALYMEESLYRGLKWVVFEPNDEPLWAQIRMNVGAFMHNMFRQGAFQGKSPKEAYFVKCDSESTTQNDINLGIVNIIVGFAPLKPAEFVVLKLQQMAGQIDV